jgi:hypothetical protein
MKKVYMIAIALVVLGVAPLLAAGPTVVAIPRAVPATGGDTTGALATMIMVGLTDPDFNDFASGGVPCFNCAPTGLTGDVGLAIPLTWVTAGSSVSYVLAVDVYSYTGGGNFIYSIREGERTQEGKEIARGNVAASIYPANWLAYFPTTAPLKPGRYTLLGEFDANGATSAVSGPLVVQ